VRKRLKHRITTKSSNSTSGNINKKMKSGTRCNILTIAKM
jgi:hypothetical protein